jgi:hypothetical protein
MELVLNQEGQKALAKRLEDKLEPAKERKEAKVDPKVFDGYIGRYELATSFTLTITRDGDFAHATAGGASVGPQYCGHAPRRPAG